jgi:hypothetical protein
VCIVQVVQGYGGPDRITLIQASDFIAELQHNRVLRDAFFPNHSLSTVRDLRKIVMLTEGRTSAEIRDLATEYAQQYLESAAEEEPRLRAIMTLGASPDLRQIPRQPGLVMSISEAERTTHLS